jgi:ABC-type nitrate/sulfonate/bicarbonate transport system permease component
MTVPSSASRRSLATSGFASAPAVRRRTRRLVAFVLTLGGWQLTSAALGADTLPGVAGCVVAFSRALTTTAFWSAAGDTLLSALAGLAIATVVAVPIGVAIGSHRVADRSTRLAVDVLRTIPPVTLLPLALLLYGPTVRMALVLIVYGAFWPMLIHSVYAIRDIEPVQKDVAAAFGLSARVRWRTLVLPSVLPMVLVGARISATIALLLSVTAELVGGAPGVGAQITSAQVAGRTEQAYVYVLCAALLGIGMNALMRLTECRAIPWHSSVREAAGRERGRT